MERKVRRPNHATQRQAIGHTARRSELHHSVAEKGKSRAGMADGNGSVDFDGREELADHHGADRRHEGIEPQRCRVCSVIGKISIGGGGS